MIRLLAALLAAQAAFAAEALIQDRTHFSQVFGETRNYRIFLPSDYGDSGKRYPAIYWFHGFSERHNQPVAREKERNYDTGPDYGGDTIGAFVSTHGVIVVKWDGYNPRVKDEVYPRPYNIGPVETARQFPLYFPELVDYIDANYRTLADREHRATAGLSMGGFMSFWIAGKYPHLVSSASNFMGSSEFYVGPRGFDVEYRHEEMRGNYDGVRTRLVTGARDFIQFYHRRMNAIWKYTNPHHETEDFDFDHGTPGMARTLDFHMRAFATPLPRPVQWSHADVYPSFSAWDWEVFSDRRQPGFTLLENVSPAGFRSSVREWLPGGRMLARTRLSITTARLYPPSSEQTVTVTRMRDGLVRRAARKADREGRLRFELDGEEHQVGIGSGPVMALASYRLEEPWARARQPVKARVTFLNKGAARSGPLKVRWETANPSVLVQPVEVVLPPIAAGARMETTLTVTVYDEAREIVKLEGVAGQQRLPLEIPLFPDAPVSRDFRIADGKAFTVFRRAVDREEVFFGKGNGDGRVNAGETFAVLIPDGGGLRAAELFTNDACLDLSLRGSDPWASYDHVGATSKYSLPVVSPGCEPGHVLRMLARVQSPDKPNHRVSYWVVEAPVSPRAASR
ncbi:MAG: hypothetical protein HY013_12760 [Candidatus Solibacter usitatus]|nr:hypothetical protein [Candidatus Solibacter usitatus]